MVRAIGGEPASPCGRRRRCRRRANARRRLPRPCRVPLPVDRSGRCRAPGTAAALGPGTRRTRRARRSRRTRRAPSRRAGHREDGDPRRHRHRAAPHAPGAAPSCPSRNPRGSRGRLQCATAGTRPEALVDWARDDRRPRHKSRRLAVLDPAASSSVVWRCCWGWPGSRNCAVPVPRASCCGPRGSPAAALAARAVAFVELAVLVAALALPGRLGRGRRGGGLRLPDRGRGDGRPAGR